jgi:hypothetical protein
VRVRGELQRLELRHRVREGQVRQVERDSTRTSEAAFVTTWPSKTTAPRAIAASGSVMDVYAHQLVAEPAQLHAAFPGHLDLLRRSGCWPSEGRRRTGAPRTAGGCSALHLGEAGHGRDSRTPRPSQAGVGPAPG